MQPARGSTFIKTGMSRYDPDMFKILELLINPVKQAV
jgi:hypothetical protein